MAVESLRIAIEVMAGVLPGQPEPEFTRRYFVTSAEWAVDQEERAILLAERNGKAQGYASWLMLQPHRLNWVRIDWVWM